MVNLAWTSTQVRNQHTTRVQITFRFEESFAFSFRHTQMSMRAQVSNQLPINPNVTHELEEPSASRKRMHSSPTESEYAPKRRQCSVQTVCTGLMLDRLAQKSRE